MIFKNKKIKKLLSYTIILGVLIPSVFFSATPKEAEAQLVTNDPVANVWHAIQTGYQFLNKNAALTTAHLGIKQAAVEILRLAAQQVAKRLLAEMTKSTVNWINTGFHGSPLFLQNPQSFFQDIAKTQVENMVNFIGYDSLRFPFGRQQALDIINSYKSQLANNTQYTLSSVISDPQLLASYRNDFNTGGWNGFLINTQYPQNNYIGSTIQIQENLASRLEGTLVSPANAVRSELQQGMGFLSPQTCATSPAGTNYNPYNPPQFDTATYEKDHPYSPPDLHVNAQAFADYEKNYVAAENTAKDNFNKTKGCPNRSNGTSGLVNTTPGSVAANAIMKSLGSGQDQGVMAAALGNSMSAIFNTLLQHFLDKGLNSLATTVNPPRPVDNFSYAGQTLGTVANNTNGNEDWSNTPDEVVDVTTFKSSVQTAIDNTQIESSLMDNAPCAANDPNCTLSSSNNPNSPSYVPGITQELDQLVSRTKDLDICLPGPDKGWEARVDKEKNRQIPKIEKRYGDDNGDATNITQELNYVVTAFKDFVNNQMVSSLPDGVNYMLAIKDLDNSAQEASDLHDAKQTNLETLARLKAIQRSLQTSFPTDTNPDPGSPTEKRLITLKKSFNSIQANIASPTSIQDRQTELKTLNDKIENLDSLNTECETERQAAGWDSIGGPTSVLTKDVEGTFGKIFAKGTKYTQITQSNYSGLESAPKTDEIMDGTEIEQFCKLPLIGGHPEGQVLNGDTITNNIPEGSPLFRAQTVDPKTGTVLYPSIPVVNALDIQGINVGISLDCRSIWKANQIDYTHAGDIGY